MNPRVHSRFLVPRSAAHPTTAPPRVLSPMRAPADGWTRRRRAAPRQSPTRATQRASDHARWSMSDAEEDGVAAGPLAGARPPMGGRTAVERLLGGALPTQPWRVLSPLSRAVARDLPTRRVDPSTAGGSGHGISTKG
jgi:hypothetical protein